MARVVRTLSFREKPWWDTPLVTLPFLGDVEPRRLLYMVVGALAGYLLSSMLGDGIAFNASGLAIGAFTGYIACRQCKAVCPEKQLLYLITRAYRPRSTLKRRELRRVARIETAYITVSEPMEPIKIHGILLDPYTGTPMSSAQLVLIVDGREVARTLSDSQGRYAFYVTLKPGTHEITVKAGDVVALRKKVVVELREKH